MRQLTALAWKEWHETRAFLWIALGVFVGLPICGGLEALYQVPGRRFEIIAFPWVTMLGSVLAVFVAVGASCRDFNGRLEDFWRSRPVGVARWLLMKYVVGLAVVQVACLIPMILEMLTFRDSDSRSIMAWFPFMWTAVYGLSFLAGCMVRRTAHAAMLGLGAMLLVNFLPMILPPLEWMNIATAQLKTVSPAEHRHFAAGMLGLAMAALAVSILGVRCNWRIDSGRRMMYGSVSAAFLILFASAGYQLGTNMPILQQIDLPAGQRVANIRFLGATGYLETEAWLPGPGNHYNSWLRTIDVTPAGIELGSPITKHDDRWISLYRPSAPLQPQIAYGLFEEGDNDERAVVLTVHDLISGNLPSVPLPLTFDNNNPRAVYPALYEWKDRLYVMGTHLITLDISRPTVPRIISDTPWDSVNRKWGPANGEDKYSLSLPPIPDLPPQERIKAVLFDLDLFDGEVLCEETGGDALDEYRLTNLTESTAEFEKVAEYKETMLQMIFGGYRYWDMKLMNGLLYASTGGGYGMFNPSVSVFATRGPQPLREVGHFAAPGAWMAYPLPDGRAIVGGDKLYLIGPPPQHGD